jgi:hypothetical protein
LTKSDADQALVLYNELTVGPQVTLPAAFAVVLAHSQPHIRVWRICGGNGHGACVAKRALGSAPLRPDLRLSSHAQAINAKALDNRRCAPVFTTLGQKYVQNHFDEWQGPQS